MSAVNMTEEEDLIVTISGPAMSMLLYENARAHDQIGFFLGEVVVYVKKQVTDSDRDVESIKQLINIKNVVSYPISEPFFDSIGQIQEEKLKRFLKDSVHQVVGWYHYRENHHLGKSFRDSVLHQQLSNFFSDINKLVSQENFIFCTLTTSLSNNNGTHKFKQLFQHKKDEKFIPVTLKIKNLGADASRSDGSDYKPAPQLSSCDTDAFHKVYEAVSDKLKNRSGYQAVTLIQHAAEHLLTQLIPKVTESDRVVSQLEEKLMCLRNEHFKRLYESRKTELSDQMSKMEVDDVKVEETPEIKSPSSPEAKSPSSPEMYSPPLSQDNLKKGKVTFQLGDDKDITDHTQRKSSPIEALEPSKSPTLPSTRRIKKSLDPNPMARLDGRGATVLLSKCDQGPSRS